MSCWGVRMNDPTSNTTTWGSYGSSTQAACEARNVGKQPNGVIAHCTNVDPYNPFLFCHAYSPSPTQPPTVPQLDTCYARIMDQGVPRTLNMRNFTRTACDHVGNPANGYCPDSKHYSGSQCASFGQNTVSNPDPIDAVCRAENVTNALCRVTEAGASCGPGTRLIRRYIEEERPWYGGKPCPAEEYEECNVSCPVSGRPSEAIVNRMRQIVLQQINATRTRADINAPPVQIVSSELNTCLDGMAAQSYNNGNMRPHYLFNMYGRGGTPNINNLPSQYRACFRQAHTQNEAQNYTVGSSQSFYEDAARRMIQQFTNEEQCANTQQPPGCVDGHWWNLINRDDTYIGVGLAFQNGGNEIYISINGYWSNPLGGVTTPVNCQVSNWGPWSSCSATQCGEEGTQTRNRTVTQQPSNGGTVCPTLTESRACQADTTTCTSPTGYKCWYWFNNRWYGLDTTQSTCQNLIRAYGTGAPYYLTWSASQPPVPGSSGPPPGAVDCQVSSWGPWSNCSATVCDEYGTRRRTRTVTQQPANGGQSCPSLTEVQSCQAARPNCTEPTGGQPTCWYFRDNIWWTVDTNEAQCNAWAAQYPQWHVTWSVTQPPNPNVGPGQYRQYANTSAYGNDIYGSYGGYSYSPHRGSLTQMKEACDADSRCRGFNSQGWIKNSTANKASATGINLYEKV